MTIFLCGFMGCGKSTVGKLAAKKLGCGFCDTDDLIVKIEEMTIPEIFEQKASRTSERSKPSLSSLFAARQSLLPAEAELCSIPIPQRLRLRRVQR